MAGNLGGFTYNALHNLHNDYWPWMHNAHKHTDIGSAGCQPFCPCPGLSGCGSLPIMCPSQNSGCQKKDSYSVNTHNSDILMKKPLTSEARAEWKPWSLSWHPHCTPTSSMVLSRSGPQVVRITPAVKARRLLPERPTEMTQRGSQKDDKEQNSYWEICHGGGHAFPEILLSTFVEAELLMSFLVGKDLSKCSPLCSAQHRDTAPPIGGRTWGSCDFLQGADQRAQPEWSVFTVPCIMLLAWFSGHSAAKWVGLREDMFHLAIQPFSLLRIPQFESVPLS